MILHDNTVFCIICDIAYLGFGLVVCFLLSDHLMVYWAVPGSTLFDREEAWYIIEGRISMNLFVIFTAKFFFSWDSLHIHHIRHHHTMPVNFKKKIYRHIFLF